MVWQHGSVPFTGFFRLFLPSVVNWLIPAVIMSFTVGREVTPSISQRVRLRPGAGVVIAIFIATIALTVGLHQLVHLPPALGMMTGLGVLNLYATLTRRSAARKERAHQLQLLQAVQLQQEAQLERGTGDAAAYEILSGFSEPNDPGDTFDIFHIMERVEWDTLMFFYGVVLCVGGLGALGYLSVMSHALYGGLGATSANVLVGVLSAIVDNIPIMFAVLSMNPEMSTNQWLLVTLTAGVGGSLLSIGSAAGVALMGHARGSYTFMSHLRWTWAVALGYAASIGVHLLVNGR
jgi:Na+/H+ antiporter NhaD/arsenite permease-like protein